MRSASFGLFLTLLLGAGAVGCNRDSGERPARQLGRGAYNATQGIKKGAKEAARDIREAGKEFRQGWREEKHEHGK